jgi:Flp pilus assembly pilin Flp
MSSSRRSGAAAKPAGSRHERGANLVEYALLIGMIAAVCIGAISTIGSPTNDPLSVVGQSIN